jgi:hypothetical protein
LKVKHVDVVARLICWVDASYIGSKMAKVPIPKVHINGKINIRMEKSLKPMFSGPYVVINQLINSI